MFAVATFQSRRSRPRLVVPGTAILRLQDRDWVFRKEGDRRFRRVEVQALGESGEGMVQVEGGLKTGDQIIATALDFSAAMAGQGK
jgi:multidrug efflux pump subunit AcrA (membrane-fusion protein)